MCLVHWHNYVKTLTFAKNLNVSPAVVFSPILRFHWFDVLKQFFQHLLVLNRWKNSLNFFLQYLVVSFLTFYLSKGSSINGEMASRVFFVYNIIDLVLKCQWGANVTIKCVPSFVDDPQLKSKNGLMASSYSKFCSLFILFKQVTAEKCRFQQKLSFYNGKNNLVWCCKFNLQRWWWLYKYVHYWSTVCCCYNAKNREE